MLDPEYFGLLAGYRCRQTPSGPTSTQTPPEEPEDLELALGAGLGAAEDDVAAAGVVAAAAGVVLAAPWGAADVGVGFAPPLRV